MNLLNRSNSCLFSILKMTVTYTNELATTRSLTIFKLFFKWKGSVLKLLWKELIVYVIIFYIIQLIYVFGLDESWKAYFEKVVRNAKNYEDVRTLSFVLGFFVTTIMTRKIPSSFTSFSRIAHTGTNRLATDFTC